MILGGTVAYEDGVKQQAGDTFSPTRKVRVELNFAVPEDPGIDPDSVLAEVMEKAVNLTNAKLGLTTATRAAKSIVAQTVAVAPAKVVTGKTKADLEAEVIAKADAAKAPATKRGPKPKVVADAATVVDDTAVVAGDTPDAAVVDAASMEDWASEAVTEYTDKDMNDHVTKKNATLKNPVAIRALIGSYNPDPKKPFTLREIPQTQRQAFLDKLEALA